ncbi:MerR family transcriptional regulator [Nocardia sp. KC 131]|uniref:MerR family transcriptional regulator n=1 Tax=Nocardia arseniciresistens TaxID=3392119 RepID=UPI00398EC2B6
MQQEPPSGSHLPVPRQAVYSISVTADLAGTGVQTLRLYERHGLITPARSDGGTRRYSRDDLARLHRIVALSATGVNLAGIARILDLDRCRPRRRCRCPRSTSTPHNFSASLRITTRPVVTAGQRAGSVRCAPGPKRHVQHQISTPIAPNS